jgi:hypothetical protein
MLNDVAPVEEETTRFQQTHPISKAFLCIWLVIAMALINWTRAFCLLRFIVEFLAMWLAFMAHVLFLQVCLFLWKGGGGSMLFITQDDYTTVVHSWSCRSECVVFGSCKVHFACLMKCRAPTTVVIGFEARTKVLFACLMECRADHRPETHRQVANTTLLAYS